MAGLTCSLAGAALSGQTPPSPTPAAIETTAAHPEGLGPIRVLYKRITEPGVDPKDWDPKNPKHWGRWDLFLYDFPTGYTTRLTDSALAALYPFGNWYYPGALSPDGRRVAFGGATLDDPLFAPGWGLMPFAHIWTLDVGTRHLTWLSRPAQPDWGASAQYRHVRWSPDGKYVAADQDAEGGDLMYAGGGGLWSVWRASGGWVAPPDKAFGEAAMRWGGGGGMQTDRGFRSWHGDWAASTGFEPGKTAKGSTRTYMLRVRNALTGQHWSQTPPGDIYQPFWTPDGQALLMVGYRGGYVAYRLEDGHPLRSGHIDTASHFWDPLRLSRNGRWLYTVTGLPNAPTVKLWDWRTGVFQAWKGPPEPPPIWEDPVTRWLGQFGHPVALQVLDILEMPPPASG